MAVSSTSAYRIIGAVKLDSIKVWSPNAASSPLANTIEVEMVTDNPYSGSTSKIFSDTAVGTTNVAYVKATPAWGSFSGGWLPVPNYALLPVTIAKITCPIGSVIDVKLTYELIDTENAMHVSGTVASATPGKLYTRPLDSTQAVPLFQPVGVSIV